MALGPRAKPSPWFKWVTAPLIAVIAGCIIVPTPPLGIHEIPVDQISHLRAGTTTRVDVLMQFGNPSSRLQQDRIFLYRWERVRAVGGVGGPVGVPIVITDSFALAIEFDDAGVVDRVGKLSGFTGEDLDKELEAWSPGLWRTFPTEATTVEMPPRESVEAAFANAVWRFGGRAGALGRQAEIHDVPGRVELTSERIVFFEKLPSAAEAPYPVGLGELKVVTIAEDRGRQVILLVRHDDSAERFTLMKSDGISTDADAMHTAREILAGKVSQWAAH